MRMLLQEFLCLIPGPLPAARAARLTTQAMKNFLRISIATFLLPTALWSQNLPDAPEPARPAVTDWKRVDDLARGEKIKVARAGRLALPCLYAGETPDYLFCDSMFSGRSLRIDRADIENVRLDQQRRNYKITIGVMATAGFVWGAAFPTSNEVHNGYPRVLDGFAGAALGSLAGMVVGLPVSLLVPGRMVYRRPVAERRPQHASFFTSVPSATRPAQ